MGEPDPAKICTSHVERQNLTIRMHMRRLTRLTNAFSKKWENLWAAYCLHFAWYNFVRRHQALRDDARDGRWNHVAFLDAPRAAGGRVIEWQPALERPPPRTQAQPFPAGLFCYRARC